MELEPLMYIRGILLLGETFTSSEDKCFKISNAFFNLARSPDRQSTTRAIFGWATNTDGTESALEFEKSFYSGCNPLANPNALDWILQPYIDAGLAPFSVLEEVQNKILAGRGTMINITNLLPDAFRAMLQTQNQLKPYGYFPPAMILPIL